MRNLSVDVLVLGAGFGGSLMALILQRIGLDVALVERGSHPRFAIGESSTPAADFVFRDLCQRYGLGELEPLTSFGTWRAENPEVMCGLKRGFSYFRHNPGQEFASNSDHSNELLVSASADDFHADTHWLRSDVDAFLVRQVVDASIPYVDQFDGQLSQSGTEWDLRGTRTADEEPSAIRVRAKFVLDATGASGEVLKTLGIASSSEQMHTSSRAVFAHFEGVARWSDMMEATEPASTADHPFDADAAAVHHVLDEGWMWQLRFENDITSAGFVIDADSWPTLLDNDGKAMWNELLSRYPSIAQQFQPAQIVAPDAGLQFTGRLQRLSNKIAGESWAALPYTAGFVDPLHSTGIAQSMLAIERIASAFERAWGTSDFAGRLRDYERTLRSEFQLIDQLVSGCYWTRSNFQAFAAQTMVYFAGATSFEHHRRDGSEPDQAFLRANDPDFRQSVDELHAMARMFCDSETSPDANRFESTIRKRLAPFDQVGLCDSTKRNMYRYDAR